MHLYQVLAGKILATSPGKDKPLSVFFFSQNAQEISVLVGLLQTPIIAWCEPCEPVRSLENVWIFCHRAHVAMNVQK